MDLKAYDDLYEEYIENILSISALSDGNHYIFYNFEIKDNVCFDEIFMLNEKGERGEFGKKNFNYNEEFYEKFIKELVQKFYNSNSINAKDVIYNNDEGTFRMITENKDIFTISGLSKEKNENLLEMIKNKDIKEEPENVLTNDTGKINYLILLFIFVLVLLIICLLILI